MKLHRSSGLLKTIPLLIVSAGLVIGLGVAASGALTPPTALVAVDTKISRQVDLSWEATGTGTTYAVQYSLAPPAAADWVTATTSPAAPTVSATVTGAGLVNAGLLNSNSYVFRVGPIEAGEVTTWTISSAVTPTDRTAPAVSLTVVPAAPNAAGWYSDTVTYTITASDPSSIKSYEAAIDGTSTPALIADGGPVSGGPGAPVGAVLEGVHTLYYRATDQLDNASAWASRDFRVDVTAPTATAVGVGGYAAGTPIKTLPQVKLEAADERGSGVFGLMYVFVAHGDSPDSAGAWTSRTGSEATVTAPAGHMDLLYRSIDVASNASDIGRFETYSDAVAPVTTHATTPITADGADGTWLTFPTIGFAGSDNTDAPTVTSFIWDDGSVQTGISTVVPSIEGTRTLRYFSTDVAGNIEGTKTASFFVDLGQPTTVGTFTDGNVGDNNYYVSRPTFSIVATAADETTIATAYYSYAGANGPWTTYGAPVVVTPEGSNQKIYHYAVDVNGRRGPVATNSYDLDTIAPVIGTVSPLFTASRTPTLTVTITDASSGVADSRANLASDVWFKSVVEVSGIRGGGYFNPETGVLTYKPFWPLVDGQNVVMIKAYDRAGNDAKPVFAYVTVDTIAPVTISDAENSYTSKATIKLWASDSGVGVGSTHYRLDGGAVVHGTKIQTSALGSHTLTFWSEDKMGNVEDVKTAAFKVAVPTRVSITSNRTYVSRGKSATFSGAVSSSVAKGSHVTLLRRKVGSSTWTTLATVHTTAGHSWSYSYKVPKTLARGTYFVVARYAGSSKTFASTSASRRLVVR